MYEGRVASGDQFISDGAVKDRLIRQFDSAVNEPICCEMHSACCGMIHSTPNNSLSALTAPATAVQQDFPPALRSVPLPTKRRTAAGKNKRDSAEQGGAEGRKDTCAG